MAAAEIYNRAEQNGVSLECTCTSISINKWNKLMKGATKADRAKVNRIIKANTDGEFDDFINLYNPYDHYKTETHIIFVHSAIEHFFRIND